MIQIKPTANTVALHDLYEGARLYAVEEGIRAASYHGTDDVLHAAVSRKSVAERFRQYDGETVDELVDILHSVAVLGLDKNVLSHVASTVTRFPEDRVYRVAASIEHVASSNQDLTRRYSRVLRSEGVTDCPTNFFFPMLSALEAAAAYCKQPKTLSGVANCLTRHPHYVREFMKRMNGHDTKELTDGIILGYCQGVMQDN